MKLDLRTRTATLLAATGAVLTAFTATALPAHAAEPTSHMIDTDAVMLSAISGNVHGVTFLSLWDNHVGMSLRTITERATAFQGCVSTRLTYIYADGSIGMEDSPRVCTKTTQVEKIFHSSATQDLVRYAVQLQTASTPTGALTTVTSSGQYVGDAPDSLGTSARLERAVLFDATRNE